MSTGSPVTVVTVACDGSSLGNPGPGGWCWYVSEDSWGAGGRPATTNNAMELEAVRALLLATRSFDGRLELLLDSRYVLDALTKWHFGWRKRGWKTASGSPVANRECIEETVSLLRGREVSFTWVRGHAGHPLNEGADRRARGAAEALKARRTAVVGPGWKLP